MSNRYKGGIISATPPTTTGGETGVASGAWTLEQQLQAQAAGNWPIQPPVLYIEDVFSTWLYTGNGATQTITNGINLSGKGGLTLFKIRNTTYDWQAFDTARGPTKFLTTNGVGDQSTNANSLTAFNSNGFTLGSAWTNDSGAPYASWTFREQPKFFDVVTYTGNGNASQTINHNLGAAPGCMFVKAFSASGNWFVYHTSLGNTGDIFLNSTAAARTGVVTWNSSTPTSTQFQITSAAGLNTNGVTYVAYLFAHNAGGFGPTEADNVISCGSYTGAANVNLGYEPQFLLIKAASGLYASGTNWLLMDTMRGLPAPGGADARRLFPNASSAENGASSCQINATGFTTSGGSDEISNPDNTYIYIAIRRGPMRTPTTGTSVFTTRVATEVEFNNTADYGITTDLLLNRYAKDFSQFTNVFDRLRGSTKILYTALTDAEGTLALGGGNLGFGAGQTSVTWAQIANSSASNVTWAFRRAPGFFDEVCYTGNSTSGATQTHNLGVVPELMIVKGRSVNANWFVYSQTIGATKYLILNDTGGSGTLSSVWNDTAPTSTTFTLGNAGAVNASGGTYVAYLFASCPGVSKVGSYTGTGTTQVINCGFTGGARFVMIKRTDSTGDWYVWDTARGMIPANDPYLLLNSTAAEVTGTDFVDTAATGFEITSTAPAAINANGGTFIFLAVA